MVFGSQAHKLNPRSSWRAARSPAEAKDLTWPETLGQHEGPG